MLSIFHAIRRTSKKNLLKSTCIGLIALFTVGLFLSLLRQGFEGQANLVGAQPLKSLDSKPAILSPQTIQNPQAIDDLNLPAPTQQIPLSRFTSYPVLKGLKINPSDPFRLEFIIDTQDKKDITEEELSDLIKYFLAALTIPEEDLWVNLSPYEKDRIIPDNLSLTDLGKDLLGEDYILKQLVSTLTYPENRIGKKYWDKTYKEVYQLIGTTNTPINTFNKVWIIPDKAEVYEDDTTAFITEAKLKVLSEQDYLALNKQENIFVGNGRDRSVNRNINKISQNSLKDIILPELTWDVNEGENFAKLRQIYHSLILSVWFKQKLKDSIYQYYIDQGKTEGINLKDKTAKDKIYNLYVQSFKKGVYNYIKADYEPSLRKNIKRRYYSGGVTMNFLGLQSIYERLKVPTKTLWELIKQFSVKDYGKLKTALIQTIPVPYLQFAVVEEPNVSNTVFINKTENDKTASSAIKEGENALSSIEKKKANAIAEEAKDPGIGEKEFYPTPHATVSANKGDDFYIITRVPEEYFKYYNGKRLKVYIYTDINSTWDKDNWQDIPMRKLFPKDLKDDRFIGRIKLNRLGIIQYTCHWKVQENKEIMQDWAKRPYRGGSLQNGSIAVRGKGLTEKNLNEEEKIVLKSFYSQAKMKGVDPRPIKQRFISKHLKSLLQSTKEKPSISAHFGNFNLKNEVDTTLGIFLEKDMQALSRVDWNFNPSDWQKQAVDEANYLLSEFYKTKIDLWPLILWGNIGGGGISLKLSEFIVLESKGYDKPFLTRSLIHEFCHTFEGGYLSFSLGLEEAKADYLTMLISEDYDLDHHSYRDGITNFAMLVELLGFKTVYQSLHNTDIKPIEESLGKNSKRVFDILGEFVLGMQVHFANKFIYVNIAELLANKDNDKYLSSLEGKIEKDSKDAMDIFLGKKARSEHPLIERLDLEIDALLKDMVGSHKEGMKPSLPQPNLEEHMKKVRQEWENGIRDVVFNTSSSVNKVELTIKIKKDLGGIDLQNTKVNSLLSPNRFAAGQASSALKFNLSPEIIQQWANSKGVTFEILSLESGVDADSLLEAEQEELSRLP